MTDFNNVVNGLNGYVGDGFANRDTLKEYTASQDAPVDPISSNAIVKPHSVLVDSYYPGVETLDANGPDSDLSFAYILAKHIEAQGNTLDLEQALNASSPIRAALRALFPQPHRRISGPGPVTEITLLRDEITKAWKGHTPTAIDLIVHIFERMFDNNGQLANGWHISALVPHDEFVISGNQLKLYIIESTLRPLTAELQLKELAKEVNGSAPVAMGERIEAFMTGFAVALPSVQLRIQQLETARAVVHTYLAAPNRLALELRTNPSVIHLAGFANFLLDVEANDIVGTVPKDTVLVREACEAVLALLTGNPRMKAMSLDAFQQLFGVHQIEDGGVLRGAVLYKARAQEAVSPLYFVASDNSGLAKIGKERRDGHSLYDVLEPITKVMAHPNSMASIASLLADEFLLNNPPATQLANGVINPKRPVLRTWMVTGPELGTLALSLADSVMLVRHIDKKHNKVTHQILYGITISERWRQWMVASTQRYAFTGDRATAVLYGLSKGGEPVVDRVAPGLPPSKPFLKLDEEVPIKLVATSLSEYSDEINRTYFATTMVTKRDNSTARFRVLVDPLKKRLGEASTKGAYPNFNGISPFRMAKMPGNMEQFTSMLEILQQFAQSQHPALVARAQSVLVMLLVSIVNQPGLMAASGYIITRATLEAQLNDNDFAVGSKRHVTFARSAVILGYVTRAYLIPQTLATQVLSHIPYDVLEPAAGITLADTDKTNQIF